MLFQSVRCLRTCNTLDSLGTYQYHTCICDVLMHVFNKYAEIQNTAYFLTNLQFIGYNGAKGAPG